MNPEASSQRTWLVVTPEYGEVEPVTDEGQGPLMFGADAVFVTADNKRDAVVLGVELMRRQRAHWFRHCDGSPYAGVKAREAQRCRHGVGDWARCLDCEREWLHDEA